MARIAGGIACAELRGALLPGALDIAAKIQRFRFIREREVTEGSRSEIAAGTAAGFVKQAAATTKIHCPHCGDSRPRRMERKGFLQERVLPVLGYYPWVCAACKSTFLMRKRYRRKSKKKEYGE